MELDMHDPDTVHTPQSLIIWIGPQMLPLCVLHAPVLCWFLHVHETWVHCICTQSRMFWHNTHITYYERMPSGRCRASTLMNEGITHVMPA